jgi:hypothetical protein
MVSRIWFCIRNFKFIVFEIWFFHL